VTIQDYNLIAAIVVLVVAVVALIHERHSGSRYLLIVVVVIALVNLLSAVDPFLQPDQSETARFIRAGLRTVVLILLLGYVLQRRNGK
jgi:hypothetical protein